MKRFPIYKQRNERINRSLTSIIECKANQVFWITSSNLLRPSLFISVSSNNEFEIHMN